LSIQKLSADQEELAKVKVEDAYDNEEEEDNKDGEDKEVKTVDTDNHDEDFDYSAGGDDGEPNYVVHGEDSDGSELEYKGTGQVKHDEQIEEDEAAEDDYDGILDRNYLSRSYSQDTIIGEHDNAEDVMNMPPSYAAPSHHSSNLEGILQGSLDITAEDVEIAKRRREQLEAHIVAGRLAHEQGVEDDGLDGETPFPAFRPSISEMQQQAGAIELTPGVVVVDSKKLDQLLGPDTDSVSANGKQNCAISYTNSLESTQTPSHHFYRLTSASCCRIRGIGTKACLVLHCRSPGDAIHRHLQVLQVSQGPPCGAQRQRESDCATTQNPSQCQFARGDRRVGQGGE
jgi:hypothetical protein